MIDKVNKQILKNSASKKGVVLLSSKIGLSHPIKFPSQNTPKYINCRNCQCKFNKYLKKYIFINLNLPARKTADKKPIKYPIVGPVKYTKPTPFSGES